MSKSKRIVGPFTSKYGTFNPGDQAIAITVCTGNVVVERVEYVGYVERNEYNWKTKKTELTKFAQIRRPTKTFTAFWAGTEEKASWPYGDRKVEYRDVIGTLVTTLQYNRLLPASASTDQLIEAV
jgi:hypothetical protein